VLPEKVKAITDWRTPTSTTEIRSFVGIIGYYRSYIKHFAEIAKPLTDLTGKKTPFQWSNEAQQAFEILKRLLTTAPILAFPEPNGKFVLDTDSSLFAAGAVLSQIQDGQEKVIAYFSKKYNDAEQKYCTTKRELFAFYLAVKQFKPYLLGTTFVTRVDHKALVWLRRFKESTGTLGRWLVELQGFSFEIQYRPGKAHANADALSRRPCPIDCQHCSSIERKFPDPEILEKDEIPTWFRATDAEMLEKPTEERLVCAFQDLEVVTTLEIIEAQQNDPEIVLIVQFVSEGHQPTVYQIVNQSPRFKILASCIPFLRINEHGLLVRDRVNTLGDVIASQVVVPASLRIRILSAYHDGLAAGHFGVTKTLRAIQANYYWPKMGEDVMNHIALCAPCITRKGPNIRHQKSYPPVPYGAPLECLYVDATVVSPTSPAGFRYILAAVDAFTRYAWARPVKQVTARTTAEFLIEDVFTQFGIPLELKMDEDTVNRADLIRHVCQTFRIRKPMKIVYDPQSRGQVESFHRTVHEYLAKVTREEEDPHWEKYVSLFLMAYRAVPHSSTGISPYQLLFGRRMPAPYDLSETARQNPLPNARPGAYVTNLQRQLESLQEFVRTRLDKPIHTDLPDTYPITNVPRFQPGDRVWYKKPVKERDRTKLLCQWEPAEIVRRMRQSLVTYIVRRRDGRQVFAHVKWLGHRH
jgi:hypothetical protein